MVIRLILLLFLSPALLISGEFTASVNSSEADPSQGFTLTLTLKDASAHSNPAVNGLHNSFTISSQHQTSSAVVTNGHISLHTLWKYHLTPKSEGELTIPSISIDTSNGMLFSEPIAVKVIARKAETPSTESSEAVFTAEVSKAHPYKSEPVLYTARLMTKHELLNVNVQPLSVEGAIVEASGEPKITKSIVDGERVNIIDIRYIISPLKEGALKIPSISIQGAFPLKRKKSSAFDGSFEPFFFVHGFDQLKPFALSTNEIVLDVQPAVLGVTPWLPARALQIEEIWDPSQNLQVGEPIIRGFKVSAEGVMSSQLPSLHEQQARGQGFKMYADKPEISEDTLGAVVRSFRKDQFTLIPQQAGELTLPEIAIAWWDTVNKVKAYAKIPARTLNIMPAPEIKGSTASAEEEGAAILSAPTALSQRDPLIYALVGGLLGLLVIAIFWGVALQRKISRLTDKPVHKKPRMQKAQPSKKPATAHLSELEKAPAKEKRETLPDLNPT